MKKVILATLTLAVAICFFIRLNTDVAVISDAMSDACGVVIDPGHGGFDGGAVALSGTAEKGINLSISSKLRDLLEFFGKRCVMTRTDDMALSGTKADDIKSRVKIVSQTANPTLISIHLNSFPQENCHGAQVFYSRDNPDSKALGELVQSFLIDGIDRENHRLAKPAEKRVYLLSNVSCPAILVECGFLSNYEESMRLIEDGYQKKLAACIAAAYLNFRM